MINTEQVKGWTEQLKEINENLDNLQSHIDNFVNNSSDNIKQQIQDVTDTACESISERANIIRDKIVEILRKQYQDAMSQSLILQAIANANPTDLGSCISVVKDITSLFVGPYKDAIKTIEQIMEVAPPLIEEVSKLTQHTPPSITLPDGSSFMPSISIKVDPISLSDITG